MRNAIMATTTVAITAAGILLSAPASAAPKIGPDGAGVMHAPCGTVGPLRDGVIVVPASAGGVVNERSGSSVNCPIRGALQPNDDAQYYCYTLADDDTTWTYLRNMRTGEIGWSRDDLLRDGGSLYWCGF